MFEDNKKKKKKKKKEGSVKCVKKIAFHVGTGPEQRGAGWFGFRVDCRCGVVL